ncbi:phosphodiester glycosidase family protein [Brevibacillus invocatus]|uniref:phosphodiester glycosidase family protein n=1 Tax=Brevibacillus invocatus TaxID=173959 RepID=UPI00203CAE4F|nr:phosphodiester glycosidase family protein [Brevibacillus invocatus]MCM3077523.1 phosphodiester glycosidase family protein [Brevibacillus invocatus]MCM3429640.1 phosphodiester glycosidase family protein [Brevibacillus invocatus]
MRARNVVTLLTASTMAWGAFVPFVPLATNVAQARSETSALQMMWQTPIGEGTTLIKYTKSYGDQAVTVMVTKVDLNNPYVEVKPIYGTNGRLTERQTITQMARETGAVAAINADFFNMTKRGAPFGIVMKDQQLVSSMGLISYWYSLGITSDKTALVEKFGFNGKVTANSGTAYPLQGINKEEYNPSEGRKSHQNQLNMYTPAFGQTSLGTISGYKDVVEVLFVDNVAKEVRVNQPGFYIPYNGYVLWGHGAAAEFLKQQFPVGSTAKVEYQTTPLNQDWVQAVGGNVLLVDQGKALTSFQADKSITSLNARTAVGASQDGKTLYMVTVEGNKGVYLDELARIMAEIGSFRAVNFDGGGSTTMSARMLGDIHANLAVRPTGGTERRVPTGLAVFNTAPTGGDLRGFQIDVPTDILIGQTVTLNASKGYDIHYLPYALNSSQVTWDTDAGTIQGQQFTPTRSGAVTISGRSGNVVQSKAIQVVSGQDIQQITVTPNPITVAPGQALTLDIKLKTKKGATLTATPQSVQVSVDSAVASVNNKLQLVAGEQPGNGTLTISYDGVSTRVPFAVGQFEQPWLTFDNQVGMYHAALPASISSSGAFAAVTEPVFRTKKAGKLVYNFSGAPSSEMRIAYGVLGAKPVMIPGNPIGIGMWVYGDNSRHWLRAEVIDANGKPVYVDLAKEIDWSGWKQVKGYFPGGVAYPLQLKSIYVVDQANDGITQDKGTLYFDEMSLLLPNQAGKPNGAIVVPEIPGSISMGSELDVKYSFAQAASSLDSITIDVDSIIEQQLPGYVPADYSFTIKPNGDQQNMSSTVPAELKLVPKNWLAGKGIGLLYVNEVNNTLDPLLGTLNAQGEWVYEVNSLGKYVPYYLDMPGAAFVDIANHPAKAEITYMANQGYVKGLTATTFGPEASLTRAQFVTLLARTFEWELPASAQLKFKDKIPDYAQGAVQVAVAKGLVKGYADNTFKPDQPVTRAEAAVILDRMVNKKGTAKSVSDSKTWPSWAASSINNVVGLGLVDPVGGKFDPNKATTRAVCVVALYRILHQQ